MKTIMMSILLFIGVAKAEDSRGFGYIGIAQGVHLQGEQINDTHPYAGAEIANVGVLAFINSFSLLSLAAYYEFKLKEEDQKGSTVEFGLKLGAIYGYNPTMSYNGRSYRLGKRFFFNNDIMIMIVPEIRGEVYKDTWLGLSLLGDSVNLGITYRL